MQSKTVEDRPVVRLLGLFYAACCQLPGRLIMISTVIAQKHERRHRPNSSGPVSCNTSPFSLKIFESEQALAIGAPFWKVENLSRVSKLKIYLLQWPGRVIENRHLRCTSAHPKSYYYDMSTDLEPKRML